jgi:hypothetical protein
MGRGREADSDSFPQVSRPRLLAPALAAAVLLALAGCGTGAGPSAGPSGSATGTPGAVAGGGAKGGASSSPRGPLAWRITADTSQETGMTELICTSWGMSLDSLADDYEPDQQLRGHATRSSTGGSTSSMLQVVFEPQDGNPPLFYYISNTDILLEDVIELRGPLTVTRDASGAITGATGTGRTDTSHTDGSHTRTQDAWAKVTVTREPDSGDCLS